MTSADLKNQGNQCFSSKDYESAIKFFTQAIELTPSDHVLYSNRSAAYAMLQRWGDALADANKTVELKPDWPRGYSRQGAALHGLEQFEKATKVYSKGLEIDPNNQQLKSGLLECDALWKKQIEQQAEVNVWAMMITPFEESGAIDYKMVDHLVDWLIQNGATGIFALSSASEVEHLSEEERISLVQRISKKAKTHRGDFPIVGSGVFGSTLEEKANSIQQLYKSGLTSVAIIPSQLSSSELVNGWKDNFSKLLQLTQDIPLTIYDLSPQDGLSEDDVTWLKNTGRITHFIDTSSNLEKIKQRMLNFSQTPRGQFITTNDVYVFSLLELARDNSISIGYSSPNTNFYPAVLAWLFRNVTVRKEQAQMVQRFISLSQLLIGHKFPRSAKKFLSELPAFGAKISCRSREAGLDLTEQDNDRIEHLLETTCFVISELTPEFSTPTVTADSKPLSSPTPDSSRAHGESKTRQKSVLL